MSKIFDLINELCPEGVEFRELGEIADIVRGQRVTKAELQNDGKYPVVSGGIKPLGFLNKFNREANTITVAQYGTAGYINFIEEKFWANDVCYCIFPKKEISNKFLLYCLMKNQEFIYSLRTNAIPAHLPQKLLSEIKLPVPPMEVQREIVRILDSFTLLTAELTARKKQYEFYRDFLLSFDELDKNGGGCELKMLGEIAEIASGGTPSTHNKIFWENGTIPWLKSEVCKDCIIEKSSLFITESGLNNSSAKIFKKGTVLMAMVGATIFKMAFLNIEAATNQNIAGIKANNKILMDKFLFYFLVKSYPELISKLSGYNMANLTQVKKIKIPVPSLQTQQKVVEILDKFDTLVNSITEGLPREIELRRKQYEHYRELLLNFKPKMRA